jgi:hypothetical protein
LLSRRLYEILGFVCGFILIDYGFNFVATGFPGARELTSQFVGANLIAGGSAVVFGSLYYILRPATVSAPGAAQPTLSRPDVGVEMIVEEETPPKSSFYRNISYVGYFFTFLGLISAADLVLQVFIRSTYNETRWWVEILLVTFGVLSYTIFGSIGHLGFEEEAKLTVVPAESRPVPVSLTQAETSPATAVMAYPELLEVEVANFTKSASGEYERHLSGEVYDAFRIERDMITIWREDRRGMRSVYLAGPYELSRGLLEEHLKRGEALTIGPLNLSVDSMRELLAMQESPRVSSPAT